jgi:hypothetical protein
MRGFVNAANAKGQQPDSKPLETLFELNDTLYAKAHVQAPQEVHLWLGVCSMKWQFD